MCASLSASLLRDAPATMLTPALFGLMPSPLRRLDMPSSTSQREFLPTADGADPSRPLRPCPHGQADDPKSEEAFDRITRIVSRVLDVPVALVSLLEPHRQQFWSAVGLPEPLASASGMPISPFLCQRVMDAEAPLSIEDAACTPWRDHPAIRDSGIAAYLGVPLRCPDGHAVGALCAIDHTPRAWSDFHLQTLTDLAATLTSELRLRSTVWQLEHERQAHTETRSLSTAALNALQDLFFLIDTEGRLLRWNQRATEVTGYGDEELTDRTIANFFTPSDQVQVLEAIEGVFRDGSAQVETRLLTRDGRTIPYEFTGALLRDASGVPLGVCGIGRDVTAQRAMEEALRLSESRHRSLIEANPDIFFRLSREGEYLDVQAQETEDLLIDDPSTLLGRTIAEFLPAAEAKAWLDLIRATLDTRRLHRYEYALVTRDGIRHHFEARIVPVGSDEVQAIVRDVTDRRRYELGLVHAIETAEEARARAEEAQARAEEAARMKAALLTNMSHEIRTPLTGIIGFAEIIGEEAVGETGEFARSISRSGRRLLDTLNAVLDLAYIEANQFPHSSADFELGPAVYAAVAELRPCAKAKGIALRCHTPEASIRIRANEKAITRAVTSLLSNAVKFTDEGTVTVEVRALPTCDEAEISVTDTGVGIDDAFLPHLFDEFRQESEGEGRSYEGSGLGLAIAKRLVEILGGTIAVKSQKGVGTTFALRLPLSPAHRPNAEPEGADAPPISLCETVDS